MRWIMSNRLKNETSPYLLQHADNPVHWFPWGDEAFEKAKAEDKPVFLSIGYSTCHWCHVMAHESFEDEQVATLLNQHFISVKVDREERPDVDGIYMAVCQAFTGSGGWPTSIFLTPDKEPFFAGTYFPKESGRGMMGMTELLQIIHNTWEKNRDSLLQQAEQIISYLKHPKTRKEAEENDLPQEAAEYFKKIFDEKYGGFGKAPKFPTPHNLLFLFDFYHRTKDSRCLQMAEKSLQQMYRGGLFDHIGYGFSRYSTDRRFLIPHFEKMLYDNALLILAYCKAYTCTKKEIYLQIAEKTAHYLFREMTCPEGGFYSAQDADSEGKEGRYYLFTPEEIKNCLGENDGEKFNRHFDITPEGNFEKKNIPNLLHHTNFSDKFDLFLPQIYQYRKNRYSLHLDDKILTFWNSLAIAAMCRLFRVSGKEKYRQGAILADRFIKKHLWDGNTLFVSYRAEQRGVAGFLDDYAGMIFAQLSLYEITLEEHYLDRAKDLCQKTFSSFWDEKAGGFFFTGTQHEKLILRQKETYDGALPSGNSMMAWNLVRLYQLTEDREYFEKWEEQLKFLSSEAKDYPAGHSVFLSALLEQREPSYTVTVVPMPGEDRKTLPLKIPADAIPRLKEPSSQTPLKDGKTTFYLCRKNTCFPPENDLKQFNL